MCSCQLAASCATLCTACQTATCITCWHMWRPVCTLAFHEPCRLPGRPAPCAHASSLPAGPHHAQHVKLPHASPAGICGVLCALLPSMSRAVCPAGQLHVLMPARCQLRHAMHSTSNEYLTDTLAYVWRPVRTLAFHEPARRPGRPSPCAHASSLPAAPCYAQHIK